MTTTAKQSQAKQSQQEEKEIIDKSEAKKKIFTYFNKVRFVKLVRKSLDSEEISLQQALKLIEDI